MGPFSDKNCRHHGGMGHHVETMWSQIVPLSNETTINEDKTASSTIPMVNG
jgi:hypothetical protein